MKKSTALSLLTFVVVMALGVWYLAGVTLQYNPFRHYTTVTMTMNNTDQLVEGTSVLIRGDKVGDVESVKRNSDGKIAVKFRYDTKYSIPQSTKVSVEQLSALGEPYINFEPTSTGAPYIKSGTTIDASNVDQPMSIPEIFQTISGLTNGISSTSLGGLLKTVNESLRGTEQALPNIGTAGQDLLSTLLARSPELLRLFSNTQVYSGDLGWVGPTLTKGGPAIASALYSFRVALEAYGGAVQKIGGTTHFDNEVKQLTDQLQPKLDALLPALNTATSPLVPIVGAITGIIPQLDISTLLSQAISLVGADGSARLTVTIPKF